MKKLSKFLETIDYDKTNNTVTNEFVALIEETCHVMIGKQLKEYIVTYGYLGYEYIEYYGVNSLQGLDADLIKQTLYLHKYFNEIKDYYVIGNIGDGKYVLVNSEDNIIIFNSDSKTLIFTNCLLEDYLIKSFKEAE